MKSQKNARWILGTITFIVILIVFAWYAYRNPVIATRLGITHQIPVSPNPSPQNSSSAQGEFITDSIEVLNDNGFILTLQNGNTENVILSATTTIDTYTSLKSAPISITEDQLSVGEQVEVVGATNPDNSISARVVRTGALPVLSSE